MLATLREGRARVQGEDAELHGTLQLSAPSDFGRNLLLPWLTAFRAAHPRLRLHLRLSDEVADVFRDPVDVAIRIGHFDDASYVALPLLEGNRRVLAASPDYLQRRGTPVRLDELREHDCLVYQLSGRAYDRWSFEVEGRRTVIPVRGPLVCDDADVVRRWAVAGEGITYNPGWTCAKTCWPDACSCCSTASAATFRCSWCARTASSSRRRCGSCMRSCASTCNRCCLACPMDSPTPCRPPRCWPTMAAPRKREHRHAVDGHPGPVDVSGRCAGVLALPGPGTFTLLTATGRGGVRGGYTALAGLLVGDQILMWLALAGVAALLKANPLVFHAVQYLGAAYLVWVGISLLRTPKHEGGDAGPIRMQPGRYFQQAILVSLLNPKAILFYMAFLPLFIDPKAHQASPPSRPWPASSWWSASPTARC